MSAYIVRRELIDYLVQAGTRPDLGRNQDTGLSWYHDGEMHELKPSDMEQAKRVGRMLWRENIMSVRTRYPDTPLYGCPGAQRHESFIYKPHEFVFDSFNRVQILKSADCYEYQSCEHEGWRGSEACMYIEKLRKKAWKTLNGYDNARWGVPTPVRLRGDDT